MILWSFSDPSCHFSSFEKLVLVFLQDVNSFRIAIHSSILHLTISEDEFILLHFPRTFNLSLWARTLYNGLSSASQEDWWVFQIFNFETSPTYFIKYLDYNITEFLSRDYFFFLKNLELWCVIESMKKELFKYEKYLKYCACSGLVEANQLSIFIKLNDRIFEFDQKQNDACSEILE